MANAKMCEIEQTDIGLVEQTNNCTKNYWSIFTSLLISIKCSPKSPRARKKPKQQQRRRDMRKLNWLPGILNTARMNLPARETIVSDSKGEHGPRRRHSITSLFLFTHVEDGNI